MKLQEQFHYHCLDHCLQSVIMQRSLGPANMIGNEPTYISSVFGSLAFQYDVCKTIVVCTMCCVENKLFLIEFELRRQHCIGIQILDPRSECDPRGFRRWKGCNGESSRVAAARCERLSSRPHEGLLQGRRARSPRGHA